MTWFVGGSKSLRKRGVSSDFQLKGEGTQPPWLPSPSSESEEYLPGRSSNSRFFTITLINARLNNSDALTTLMMREFSYEVLIVIKDGW